VQDMLTDLIWPGDNGYSLADWFRDKDRRSPAHWFNTRITGVGIYACIVSCLAVIGLWLLRMWSVL